MLTAEPSGISVPTGPKIQFVCALMPHMWRRNPCQGRKPRCLTSSSPGELASGLLLCLMLPPRGSPNPNPWTQNQPTLIPFPSQGNLFSSLSALTEKPASTQGARQSLFYSFRPFVKRMRRTFPSYHFSFLPTKYPQGKELHCLGSCLKYQGREKAKTKTQV